MADHKFTICRAKPPPRCTCTPKVSICLHSLRQHSNPSSPDQAKVPLIEGNVEYTQTITITCKYCGSKNVVKYGRKGGIQYYLCKDCKHTFAGTDALPEMRYPPDQIASCLTMFYDGLSIDAIRRQLQNLYNIYPSDSTVYRWLIRFTGQAVIEANLSNVHVGDLWIADETVLKIDEGDVWFWDIIDDETRFLMASHMSLTRTTQDAYELMMKALDVADKSPKVIITDKLRAYLDGIELAFGANTKHIQSEGFRAETNTNLIERFHGTLKARNKVMRGLHNRETARLIMDGWLLHYNFFRPHEALADKTPGEAAKADFPYKSWKDVVRGLG